MISNPLGKVLRARQGRRGFLRAWVTGAGAAVGAVTGRGLLTSTASAQTPAANPPLPDAPGNTLVRMQREVDTALARPAASRRWTMVIDPRKCIGCQACVIACRAENVVGPVGSYRRVPQAEVGAYPSMANVFMPANCVQCDDPPCARAVPAGMIQKRPDGIVQFDYTQLKGPHAAAAAAACPYRAVHVDDGRYFTDGTPRHEAYESRTFAEYGGAWRRGQQLTGVARKCHFCAHRLEAGELPACVTTCIGGAMFFGDAADANSLASLLVKDNRTIRIHEELGIQPRVYYIEDKLPQGRHYSCATCH
ncbi:MAG: 4Fe-4S dicluster domain-containing protein [Acidobacteriota bacterium]